jgi:hypothetical protein
MATATQLATPSWNGAKLGKDVAAVFLDSDGATAWGFQFLNPGFVRWNLATNTKLFEGKIFNDASSDNSEFLDEAGNNIPMWRQDAHGHYYTSYSLTHAPTPSHTFLYKLSLGSGSAGDLGNSYLVTNATLDLTALSLGSGSLSNMAANGIVFDGNDANTYLAWQGSGANSRKMFVVKLNDMSFVGSFDSGNSSEASRRCFADSSGNLWGVWSRTSAGNEHLLFAKWVPSSGAAANVLNSVVATAVSKSSLGFLSDNNNLNEVAYIPSSNSVIAINRASPSSPDNAQLAVIRLSDLTVTNTRASNSTFSYTGQLIDALFTACLQGVQIDGSFAIQGNTLTAGQLGGVLNIIDPNALTSTSTLDVTALINSTGGLDPVPQDSFYAGSPYSPFSSMGYDQAHARLVVTFEASASPAYLISMAASTCTVTGNILGGDFVRFRLRGFNGQVPQVRDNSAVIAETIIDAFPDSVGDISQALWQNSSIAPAATFYTVEVWANGRITSSRNFIITCPWSLNTATPIAAQSV